MEDVYDQLLVYSDSLITIFRKLQVKRRKSLSSKAVELLNTKQETLPGIWKISFPPQ